MATPRAILDESGLSIARGIPLADPWNARRARELDAQSLGDWLRSVRALWPVLLVAGGSFAVSQFVASNFLDYALTDVLSSLGSLIVTILFLQVWRPAPDPEFAVSAAALAEESKSEVAPWQGWLPWLIVSGVVGLKLLGGAR